MTAHRDPIVAQALDALLPEPDFDPGKLLLAARTDAAGALAVRRRRQTVAAIALAALLLLAGASFAAQKLDLLSFLHTNDRNTARFSISPSRRYGGPAPAALVCPKADARAFACHVASAFVRGTRQYELASRTAKVPLLTRHGMLAALARAQNEGVDPTTIARVRSDLAEVGDGFIRALAVMIRIETVSGSTSGSSGLERVPPRGVPAWVACRQLTLVTFRCRHLAARVGVASGTPLYTLQPSRDWRSVKAPKTQPFPLENLLEHLLGRPPTKAEQRFLVDFLTVAATGGGGPVKGKTTEIAVPTPRGAALLGPQTLGVSARIVSATTLPLPRRLPGGLTRHGDVRLYRVVFDLRRAEGVTKAGSHTLYVYVTRSRPPAPWGVAWVSTKP